MEVSIHGCPRSNMKGLLLISLLLNCLSFLNAADASFEKELVEVVQYCWKNNWNYYLRNLENNFDFENYQEWTVKQYHLDKKSSSRVDLNPLRSLPPKHTHSDLSNPILRKMHYLVNNFDALKKFIETGQEIPFFNGLSIAHLAAKYNRYEVIEFLLQTVPWVLTSVIAQYETSPLHMAILHGAKESVKVMLTYRQDLILKDAKGQSAIDMAIGIGNPEIIMYFIEIGQIFSTKKHSYVFLSKATLIAVRWGYLDAAAYLNQFTTSRILDPSTGTNLLHLAAKISSPEVVAVFCRSLSPIQNSADGWMPHHYAIQAGNLNTLSVFSESLINISGSCGFSFMDAAVKSGKLEIVRTMAERYNPSHYQLVQATFTAIFYGHRVICVYLLERGVSLLEEHAGIPLIDYIVEFQEPNLAEWISLCKHMEWSDSIIHGRRLSDFAVETGQVALLESLFLTGLNPDFCLARGIEAIEYAKWAGYSEIGSLLTTFKSLEIDSFQF